MTTPPNRWLHLRHPEGFDEVRFDAFCAFCRIWGKLVEAYLADRRHIMGLVGEIEYVVFPPTLSEDRKIASLPLGGSNTIGSRSFFEDHHWRRAWENFDVHFLMEAEEGITEDCGKGMHTNWRQCLHRESE